MINPNQGRIPVEFLRDALELLAGRLNFSNFPARQGMTSERDMACFDCAEGAVSKQTASAASNRVQSGTPAPDPSSEVPFALQIPQPATNQIRQISQPKGNTMSNNGVTTSSTSSGVDANPAQDIADRLNALNTQIANMGVSVAENTAGSDLAKSKGKQAST